MPRLNLTLSAATMKALTRKKGRPAASVARDLIEEGLARLSRAEQARKLARDYAAGREDALELLADFEPLNAEALELERD